MFMSYDGGLCSNISEFLAAPIFREEMSRVIKCLVYIYGGSPLDTGQRKKGQVSGSAQWEWCSLKH